MNDPGMAAKHAPVHVDDVARESRARLEPLNDIAIPALRNEADVLAVRLGGGGQSKAVRGRPDLGFFHIAQGKADELQLFPCDREEKITLVA